MEHIGQRFKTIRECKSITLRQVEQATGISNSYLSQLENGKITKPSYKTVQQLCDYYGIKAGVGITDMDELQMLISTMSEIEVDNLILFAKHILLNRKTKNIIN